MSFIPAGEILGENSLVRSLTLSGHPVLPEGTYGLIDAYCTDPGCDCRKVMILVHLNERHVSTINYGWESEAFYRAWYGSPLDAQTLSEMQGPSIDIGSPNLVQPKAMLAFFIKLLDQRYREHFRDQYTRFRAAVATRPEVKLPY